MKTAFNNLTYEGDARVGPVGDAGLIFRVSKPDIGADAYLGYYAGISAASAQFIFGYASNGWHAVASVPMTIASNTFYHLKIQASGASLKFFVTDTNTPILSTQDSHFAGGMVGVRDYCADPNQSLSGFANLVAIESAATVTNSLPAGLLHRWSFNGDGTDSVAGSNATLQGSASISSNSLVLSGTGHLTSYATVNIASDFANNPSMTLESWMTVSNFASWAKVWMFGNSTANYIDFTPYRGNNGNVPSIGFNPAGTEVNTGGGTFEPPVLTAGTQYYAAAVYNSYSNTIGLYLNGVLVATNNMEGANLTQVLATKGYFGASLFNDPDLSGSINEARIWSGALGTNAIMRNYLAGPDILIVPPPRPIVSHFSIIGGPAFQLSGTGVAGQAYTLQSASNLGPIINWASLATNTVGAGGLFQFTDPQITNYLQRFYRVITP
jgi:hypothetical protein